MEALELGEFKVSEDSTERLPMLKQAAINSNNERRQLKEA